MTHIQRFNEEFDDFIETVIKYIESHREYQNMNIDDIIEELKKEKLLSTYMKNNADKVKEYLQKKRDTITRKHLTDSQESDTIIWSDLLDDMKRDMGEYTDISSRDFRYLTKWLENKLVDKKVIK
jgi:hypothetical protein